jgi:hypothetical protein
MRGLESYGRFIVLVGFYGSLRTEIKNDGEGFSKPGDEDIKVDALNEHAQQDVNELLNSNL